MNNETKENEKELRELVQQIDTYTSFEVFNAEQYEQTACYLKEVKTAKSRLKTLKETMTKPIKQALDAVNDLFSAPEERLANLEFGYKAGMLKYTIEQERIQREEQRKADEEAEKQRQKLMAQAAKAKTEEKAEQIRQRADSVMAPVISRDPPKIKGVSTRDNWTFRIKDEEAVPREFCKPDEVKIRRYVKAMQKQAVGKIAGVEVYNDPIVAAGKV